MGEQLESYNFVNWDKEDKERLCAAMDTVLGEAARNGNSIQSIADTIKSLYEQYPGLEEYKWQRFKETYPSGNIYTSTSDPEIKCVSIPDGCTYAKTTDISEDKQMKYKVGDLVKLKNGAATGIHKNFKDKILKIYSVRADRYGLGAGYYASEDVLVPYVIGQDSYDMLRNFVKSGIFGNLHNEATNEDRSFLIIDKDGQLIMVYQDKNFDRIEDWFEFSRDGRYVSALYDVNSFNYCGVDDYLIWSHNPTVYKELTTITDEYVKLDDIEKVITEEKYGLMSDKVLIDILGLKRYKFAVTEEGTGDNIEDS